MGGQMTILDRVERVGYVPQRSHQSRGINPYSQLQLFSLGCDLVVEHVDDLTLSETYSEEVFVAW